MSATGFEAAPSLTKGEWVPMAGWGVRVAARLLDELLALVGLVPYLLGATLALSNLPSRATTAGTAGAAATTSTDPGQLALGAVLMLVGLVLMLGIFIWNRVIRQGRTGQSVGKSALHLYLVSANDGSPIGAGTSFVREIVHIVDGVFYLGYLWPLWDPKRQTFADKIINTVVAHPQGSQPQASPPQGSPPAVSPELS